MKTLISSLTREFKLILRNSISLYMVVAPALLAAIFIIVFGAVQDSSLSLAVDTSIGMELIARLEKIANVERFDSLEKMKVRIESADSIAGVTMEKGRTTLYVEGNEGDDFTASMQSLVGMALGGKERIYNTEAIAPKSSLGYDVSMISVLLLSLFIGGATVGLSIVNERESGVMKAISVSPLRLSGYVIAKLVPALILCVAGMIAATLIMGKAYGLLGFLLLAVCSILVSGLMIFVIGGFANNQIAAIGVLKLLMPLSMVLPISAIFVPENWQFLYYVFPMYWQYIAIKAVNDGAAVVRYCLITLAVSFPWFLAAVLLFAKKTKLRVGR